jgi:hypothetical protein
MGRLPRLGKSNLCSGKKIHASGLRSSIGAGSDDMFIS